MFFKFKIDKNQDGSRVSYSPNWCGTRDQCGVNEKALLFDDRAGFGIGVADDGFIPTDVEVLTQEEAEKLIAESDGELVFKGQKLADRWLPETQKEQAETPAFEDKVQPKPVTSWLEYCPICHKIVALVTKYDNGSISVTQSGKRVIQGIITTSINLTCPDGHRVKVVTDGR